MLQFAGFYATAFAVLLPAACAWEYFKHVKL